MSGKILPVQDELGFFELRLESIGGLGAHLAGKILAEAGVLGQGLNGAHFSSYGSEKKGTPVKSFVRLADPDREVRSASPVLRPHVVAVFHAALIRTEDVARGLREGGTILVNTALSPAEMRERLGVEGVTVGVVDALGIAVEEKTRVNTAMLGAIARVCGFLSTEILRDSIRKTFEHKYPQLVQANLRTFDRGYQEVRLETFPDRQGAAGGPAGAGGDARTGGGPLYGYATQASGGALSDLGSTARKDLSASRQGFLPEFIREKCIDCGQCDLVCPDFCFVWTEGRDKKGRPAMVLEGIDYQYCKGCLKCVEACPTDALADLREAEGYAAAHRVPHRFSAKEG